MPLFFSSKKDKKDGSKSGSVEEREFDIVVHGATGYTGQLVAAYLAQAPSASKVKWAVSGRKQSRVDKVAEDCISSKAFAGTGMASATNPPKTIVADSLAEEEMIALARRTRIVIACAGPFSEYGTELAKKCVEAGTHYVDITGEFTWVRTIIKDLDNSAKANQVTMLPCSGFDCVASDITNYYAYEVANKEGLVMRRVEVAFDNFTGGASRGTLESVLHIMKNMKKEDASGASLVNDKKARENTPTPATKWIHWHPVLKKYVGPFVMSVINERVVRRTNFLVPNREFEGRYNSYVEMSQGSLLEVIAAYFMTLLMGLLRFSFIASLYRNTFPEERQGPKNEGKWGATALGYVSEAVIEPSVKVRVDCSIDGYRFTALSVVETALAILEGEFDDGADEGGVRTAGSTVASALRRRLEDSTYVKFENIRN